MPVLPLGCHRQPVIIYSWNPILIQCSTNLARNDLVEFNRRVGGTDVIMRSSGDGLEIDVVRSSKLDCEKLS